MPLSRIHSAPVKSWVEKGVWYTAATAACGFVVISTSTFIDSIYARELGRVGFVAISLLAFGGAVWLASTRTAPAVHGFAIGLGIVAAGTTVFGIAAFFLAHPQHGLFGLRVLVVLAGLYGLYTLVNGHNPAYALAFALAPLMALWYAMGYVPWVMGHGLSIQILTNAAWTVPFAVIFGGVYFLIGRLASLATDPGPG